MPKSQSKSILFCRTTHEGKTHQYPVAVFNDVARAKNFVTFLHLAYKSNDAVTAKKLDPKTLTDKGGKLIQGTKWSVATVPYEPVVEVDETPELEEMSATS